jgi:hypothetical protein
MKALMAVTVLAMGGLVLERPTVADDEGACSIRSLAGRWVFATGVGQFPAFGGDITAIGTLNIDRDGNVSGEFDATVASVDFLPSVGYSGSVTVDPDCTGTLTFVTTAGTARTDSIVVPSERELWSMSQDPGNLWTVRARKISGRRE